MTDSKPVLVYDTETTGLPLFREPSEHPGQPHIVQIAVGLYGPAGDPIDLYDTIVRPDGWTIPDDVAKIHGITTERAMDEGIPERDAIEAFLALHDRAGFRVAHNEQFDARIVRIALMRFHGGERADAWKDAPAKCTQTLATPILKLPPTDKMRAAGRFHFKSANLTECMKHFFGEDHSGAHSAVADRDGCARVYFHVTAPVSSAAPSTTTVPGLFEE